MATQTISANHRDNPQGAPGMALSYGSQPGSPTLTNPDMILPDYNDPETNHAQLHPFTWNSGHSIEHGFQFTQNTFYSNPNPLTTPIIYGNGTMLSDIGEVTEVESTVGVSYTPSRNASRRSDRITDDDTPLQSIGKKIAEQKAHYAGRERRPSMESTSTINMQDNGAFLDFDDSASIGGDSNFQGDDEESLASSYVDDTQTWPNLRSTSKSSVQRLSDDSSSTISISRRAEEILATAKLRLTTMEDNLTRARTLSYSPVSDRSTPSHPIRGARSALRGPVMPSSHSRNMSENSVAGGSKLPGHQQRSASALGAAGGYRRSLLASRSVDALGSVPARGAYTPSHEHLDAGLEPLSEDDYASVANNRQYGTRSANLASPTFSTHSDAGPTRFTSVTQMRDIQYQMKGLKGKISSLREQARADSMKRRSLQNLRNPSPFTHAALDQGFVDLTSVHSTAENSAALTEQAVGDSPAVNDKHDQEEIDDTAGVSEEEGGGKIDSRDLEAQDNHDANHQSKIPNGQEASGPRHQDSQEAYNDRIDSLRRKVNDTYESEMNENSHGTVSEDYESQSGESLYHDSFQDQVSHEDREDAFDYERFFLHSAMSTVSGQRSRSGSVSSNCSVETTRGPIMPRQRSGSMDTATSVDTFATAAEGLTTRSSTAQGVRIYTPGDLFDECGEGNGTSLGNVRSRSDGAASSHSNWRRQNPAAHRPSSASPVSTLHRPSFSSFDSTGTARSFPLVNKAKLNGGILTPDGSPDHGLKQVTKSLMSDTASIRERDASSRGQSPAVRILNKEDQSAVERMVASLGKCVLALSEHDGAHSDGHDMYRRRIEAARQILDGEVELP